MPTGRQYSVFYFEDDALGRDLFADRSRCPVHLETL